MPEGNYDAIKIVIEEETDEGLTAWPIAAAAGPTVQCKILRTDAGLTIRHVHWTVTRRGDRPIAPAARSLTAANGYTLLRRRVGVPSPSPTSSQDLLWTLEGTYTYALSRVRPADGDIPAFGGEAARVPNSSFKTGALNDSN